MRLLLFLFIFLGNKYIIQYKKIKKKKEKNMKNEKNNEKWKN